MAFYFKYVNQNAAEIPLQINVRFRFLLMCRMIAFSMLKIECVRIVVWSVLKLSVYILWHTMI